MMSAFYTAASGELARDDVQPGRFGTSNIFRNSPWGTAPCGADLPLPDTLHMALVGWLSMPMLTPH